MKNRINEIKLVKSGIVRKLDKLGRFTFPTELSKISGFEYLNNYKKDNNSREDVIITVDKYTNSVILKPYKENKNEIGIVRKFDKLNRICIPKEMKISVLWENEYDEDGTFYVEMFFIKNTNNIAIRRYGTKCCICNSDLIDGEHINYKGRNICNSCAISIRDLV